MVIVLALHHDAALERHSFSNLKEHLRFERESVREMASIEPREPKLSGRWSPFKDGYVAKSDEQPRLDELVFQRGLQTYL
jgi:hypothetical protein